MDMRDIPIRDPLLLLIGDTGLSKLSTGAGADGRGGGGLTEGAALIMTDLRWELELVITSNDPVEGGAAFHAASEGFRGLGGASRRVGVVVRGDFDQKWLKK